MPALFVRSAETQIRARPGSAIAELIDSLTGENEEEEAAADNGADGLETEGTRHGSGAVAAQRSAGGQATRDA